MTYVTRWSGDGFLAEFSGEVSGEEVEAVNAEFTGDPRFDTVHFSIWDMSRVTRLNLSQADVESAAAIDKGASLVRRSLRGAIVVPEGQVRVLVELYLGISDELENSWDTRLFADIAAARRWLEA